MKLLLKLFLCSISIYIIGCSISDDGTFRDQEGNILYATADEIAETQLILLNAKVPEDLPKSAEGGVLFDGKVISINITPTGLRKTLFNLNRVLYGSLGNKKELIICSPPPGKAGIDFKVDKTYRVFTVYLNKAYRTWDWLGTFKLDENENKK